MIHTRYMKYVQCLIPNYIHAHFIQIVCHAFFTHSLDVNELLHGYVCLLNIIYYINDKSIVYLHVHAFLLSLIE